ncbi:MAG: VOC family protein [Hyphomonadaceae bacterium]|nr:VOC family protein [Hyphomonadaceae bacterium]
MAIELNHTIVHARDKVTSAAFLAEILGLPAPEPFYHFMVVRAANGVSLDYLSTDDPFEVAHYAFLVSEAEFDEIWGRIKSRGLAWYADPARRQKGEINRHDGGRGLYFEDPDGHVLEIITRPYGAGG